MVRSSGQSGLQPIFAGDTPKLRRQLSFLGSDFEFDAFVENLKEPSIHSEARSVVQSFAPDTGVRVAQRAVGAYCDSVLVPDKNKTSQQANFQVSVDDIDSEPIEKATIYISPNAIGALYKPVNTILEQFASSDLDKKTRRDTAAEIALRGVYTNVYAQFLVKRHAQTVMETPAEKGDVSLTEKIDVIYEHKFIKDGIEDWAVRINRIAMCVGGAAMIKLAVNRLTQLGGNVLPIGMKQHDVLDKIVRLYAKGMSDRAKPNDQQEVTFPLVNAFTAAETAGFMRNWFVVKPPQNPDQRGRKTRALKRVV